MLIKCTKKLLDELKVKPSEATEPDFYSWHANITTVNRHKAVVLINDATRTAILLYGLKAADFKRFDTIITDAIKETISVYGTGEELIGKYITGAGAVCYAKTDNKKVMGSLNQIITRILPYHAEEFTTTSFNQMSFNIHMSKYPFTFDGKYLFSKELFQNYMAKLEKGEALEEEKVVIPRKAYQFKITLLLEEFDIWRRIIVPADISFKQLHFVIQDLFNWLSYHLYDFKIFDNSENGTQTAMITNNEDAEEFLEDDIKLYSEKTPLSEFIPEYKRILYSYDYGDGWELSCELESITDNYMSEYPALTDGSGDAPPDDVGGEGGYAEFLEAVGDKNNPDHDDMNVWGKSQGFRRFNIDMTNKKLMHSLKRKR